MNPFVELLPYMVPFMGPLSLMGSTYGATAIKTGASDSVVVSGTMLQAGRSRVPFPIRPLEFSIDLIIPAALWH
jgi:hypothetical protein